MTPLATKRFDDILDIARATRGINFHDIDILKRMATKNTKSLLEMRRDNRFIQYLKKTGSKKRVGNYTSLFRN